MFLFAFWMVRNEKTLAITKPGGEVRIICQFFFCDPSFQSFLMQYCDEGENLHQSVKFKSVRRGVNSGVHRLNFEHVA